MESFVTRRSPAPHFLLSEAAALLEGEVRGSGDPRLNGIRNLRDAGPGDISVVTDRKYLEAARSSQAGAFLVSPALADELSGDVTSPQLVIEGVQLALTRLLEWLHPRVALEPGIHPTAVIGRGAKLGTDLAIGPYAVIEAGAELGDGVRIGAHSVVGSGVRIGARSVIHPHVVLYPGSVLGQEVILHSGVRIGVDGFGYVFVDGEHRNVPHVGRCVLEDGVEVGANTTIDRGSISDTRVGVGTKIDNLVQLGHNVQVGPRSILVSQTGIAGSTRLGAGVVVGGQVGIAGHVEIGDGAQLAGQAGVTGNVASGSVVMGFPARPRQEFLRTAAAQRKVPELLRRVRDLEKELETLKQENPRSTGS